MNKVHFSSKSIEWATPVSFFNDLNKEFRFTLDPCATVENHKCDNFYTVLDNGLIKPWFGVVFCNPPYSRELPLWVKKAYFEHIEHNLTIVLLIPARTDTSYFHDYIYHTADEIRFIRGRLKFNDCGSSAPFPSMLVVWRSK